jgi:hypothetical protein
MNTVAERSEIVLVLRKIGNSQGVVLPKALLEGLDFSQGIAVYKRNGGLCLKPASIDEDPFGFGAAVQAQIAAGSNDSLLIPDVLDGDNFSD